MCGTLLNGFGSLVIYLYSPTCCTYEQPPLSFSDQYRSGALGIHHSCVPFVTLYVCRTSLLPWRQAAFPSSTGTPHLSFWISTSTFLLDLLLVMVPVLACLSSSVSLLPVGSKLFLPKAIFQTYQYPHKSSNLIYEIHGLCVLPNPKPNFSCLKFCLLSQSLLPLLALFP